MTTEKLNDAKNLEMHIKSLKMTFKIFQFMKRQKTL